jgi:thiamine kinase-like enzyme
VTRKRCTEVIARLEAGFATLIHGDMHPGNVIATPEKIWLVDWSYACNSLNLFDLDYVQSFPIESSGPAWAQIYPEEARMVLPAYFKAAGLEGLDITRIHQAVMVWSLLRSIENAVKNGYRSEALKERQQLMGLLAH